MPSPNHRLARARGLPAENGARLAAVVARAMGPAVPVTVAGHAPVRMADEMLHRRLLGDVERKKRQIGVRCASMWVRSPHNFSPTYSRALRSGSVGDVVLPSMPGASSASARPSATSSTNTSGSLVVPSPRRVLRGVLEWNMPTPDARAPNTPAGKSPGEGRTRCACAEATPRKRPWSARTGCGWRCAHRRACERRSRSASAES